MAKKLRFLRRSVLIAVVIILVVGTFLYLRPLPHVDATVTINNLDPTSKLDLPWPKYGQAALGAQGFGVLETHGQQNPSPTASIAKVMTAYSLLQRHPLKLGEQGPAITVSQQDVTTYNAYYSKGGSVAKVVKGEKISEYQALQAMLLPSANNFADLLANWSFGSLENYIVYANNQTKALGMKDTKISDASGFSPQTLSTARDLVLLGQAALKNPVIAQIVAQEKAKIPEAGEIHNVNWLLNMDNVNGIKTGDTDQAGGCFLFSSKREINGHNITLIGAIMGAPGVNKAISDAQPLITASDKGFKTITPVHAGQTVGFYKAPWGSYAKVVAKNDISMWAWQNQSINVSTQLKSQKAAKKKDAMAGLITINVGQSSASTSAVLAQRLDKPSIKWRVFNR